MHSAQCVATLRRNVRRHLVAETAVANYLSLALLVLHTIGPGDADRTLLSPVA